MMKLICTGANYVRPSKVFVFQLRQGFQAGESVEVSEDVAAEILRDYPGCFSIAVEAVKEAPRKELKPSAKKVLGSYEVKDASAE